MTGAELPIMAGLAAIGTGVAVHQGEQQASAQRESLRTSKTAADNAARETATATERARQTERQANQNAPDLLALLAGNTGPRRSATSLSPLNALFGGNTALGL